MAELLEVLLPVRSKFRRHPPLDEGPAHGRRIGLELAQLLDIFLRERIRDGGHDLRHFHQRPFQATECCLEVGGMLSLVDLDSQIALTGDARGKPAHGAADLGISLDAAGKGIAFAVVSHDPTLRDLSPDRIISMARLSCDKSAESVCDEPSTLSSSPGLTRGSARNSTAAELDPRVKPGDDGHYGRA